MIMLNKSTKNNINKVKSVNKLVCGIFGENSLWNSAQPELLNIISSTTCSKKSKTSSIKKPLTSYMFFNK